MSCCPHDHHETPVETAAESCHSQQGPDWLLLSTSTIIIVTYLAYLFAGDAVANIPWLGHFAHSAFELANTMWWGVLAGIIFVGIMSYIPREFVMRALGKGGTLSGILRACMGGMLMDLCSHGILLVGMKLYERGASLGQVMAFLIASPWNSFSLTFILIALIGLPWTLTFIVLSVVIAVISGRIFERLVYAGILPPNPHHATLPEEFRFFAEAKRQLKAVHWQPSLFAGMLKMGFVESRMVLRWVFLGIVLAAAIRSLMPDEQFATYFGATALGLVLTVIAATVIEVCSEGSAPIAADLLTRANAPGNSFAFLMTGVSTDYTEIMAIKETTRSWKVAFFLPLVTLPQVIVLALVINVYS